MNEPTRTKILATLGPVTQSPDMIVQLIESGANAFRLNFSHATHADHEKSIKSIRKVSRQMDRPVAILPFGRLGSKVIRFWLLFFNGQILALLPEPRTLNTYSF